MTVTSEMIDAGRRAHFTRDAFETNTYAAIYTAMRALDPEWAVLRNATRLTEAGERRLFRSLMTRVECTLRTSRERLDLLGKSTVDLEEREKEVRAALNEKIDAALKEIPCDHEFRSPNTRLYGGCDDPAHVCIHCGQEAPDDHYD